MSIKLRFEKGTLTTQVVLKDDALVGLLDLISKHQSDDEPIAATALPPAATIVALGTEASAGVKEWLIKHSAPEVLNRISWITNPEKILLLGAFHEAKAQEDVWRSADVDNRFIEAREAFPANFPRDIRTAIKDGLVAPVTPRTYRVSRTGWNKIADAIGKLAG